MLICWRHEKRAARETTAELLRPKPPKAGSRVLLERIPADKRSGLLAALAQDPRPRYQEDPDRVYGMAFAGFDIRFRVENGVLKVKMPACSVAEIRL